MPSTAPPPSSGRVRTFVRIRPLTPRELNAQDAEVPALASGDSAVLGGFTGVIGPAESNLEVFERCLAPQTSLVISGGSLSLFSYGYTGGGKTHTVVGYGGEKGLYFLAAERLLRELDERRSAGDAAPGDRPFLKVTACEIYDDRVFDLLGPQKLECSLRVDDDGVLQVVGPSTTEQLEGARTTAPGGGGSGGAPSAKLATLVTRTSGLRSVSVSSASHLEEVAASCVGKRAVGSSTEHAQSSRSHMLLRTEVATEGLLEAQARLDGEKVAAPALRNDLENAGAAGLADCFGGAYWSASGPGNCKDAVRVVAGSSLGEVACVTASPLGDEALWHLEADGDLEVDRSVPPGERPMAFALKGRGDQQRTMDEWAAELGATAGVCDCFAAKLVPGSLARLPVVARTVFADEGEWERRYEKHEALKAELKAKLDANAASIAVAKAAVAEAQARGGAAVGGSLLLADLAGADYDHRSGAAQKESAAINKSLLALKECLRSLAAAPPARGGRGGRGGASSGGGAARPKFRDTKLTRMLEDSLAPNAASLRRNRESASVMLVNVSPAASLEQPTLNSIRYGQLFTASSAPSSSSGTAAGRAAASTSTGGRPAANKPWMVKKGSVAASGAPASVE